MAGFISFPALQPEFQRLWTLSDSEAEFISGIYFAGYVIAVPLVSGLTDRLVSAALWRLCRGRRSAAPICRGCGRRAKPCRRSGRERQSPSLPRASPCAPRRIGTIETPFWLWDQKLPQPVSGGTTRAHILRIGIRQTLNRPSLSVARVGLKTDLELIFKE